MTAKATRASLAATIKTGVPSGWIVYSEPPEVLSGPAVVIGPRDPYLTRVTTTHWDLHLRLSILVPRTAVSPMDTIDDVIDSLRTKVLNRSDVTWSSVGELSVLSEGNVDHILAAIDVSVLFDPTS